MEQPLLRRCICCIKNLLSSSSWIRSLFSQCGCCIVLFLPACVLQLLRAAVRFIDEICHCQLCILPLFCCTLLSTWEARVPLSVWRCCPRTSYFAHLLVVKNAADDQQVFKVAGPQTTSLHTKVTHRIGHFAQEAVCSSV